MVSERDVLLFGINEAVLIDGERRFSGVVVGHAVMENRVKYLIRLDEGGWLNSSGPREDRPSMFISTVVVDASNVTRKLRN